MNWDRFVPIGKYDRRRKLDFCPEGQACQFSVRMYTVRKQTLCPGMGIAMATTLTQGGLRGKPNKILAEDRPAHEWYRFVLSFPPHVVREYLGRFDVKKEHCVLDPFCGTATTLVECKKRGIPSIGIEANPMAFFASQVKVDWRPNAAKLMALAQEIADKAFDKLREEEAEKLRQQIETANASRLAPLKARLDAVRSQGNGGHAPIAD